ncbi:MAG: flagellar basal body-associated FliL family protein, partial [SAR324 cluster bacterium]|nr:flagellar basal body-associated FliL family protein [SAR324 cluster bacterium]
IPVFFQLGSYSVMLADGKYNLRVGLQLLMSNEPAKFYLNARMPLIKDALNEFLPGLTGEKLHSEEGRDEMRKAVIKKIHEVFPEVKVTCSDHWPIRELTFDEYVITIA